MCVYREWVFHGKVTEELYFMHCSKQSYKMFCTASLFNFGLVTSLSVCVVVIWEAYRCKDKYSFLLSVGAREHCIVHVLCGWSSVGRIPVYTHTKKLSVSR